MNRRKDKKEDERARMESAVRRLEELLQDPGPGITVTPVGERDHGRFNRANENPAGSAIHQTEAATQVRQEKPQPVPSKRAPPAPAPANEPQSPPKATPPADNERRQGGTREDPPSAKPEWVEKLSGSPKAPPGRSAAKEKRGAEKHGSLAGGLKGFSPSRSSAGLFGLCLRWLLGPHESEVKNAVRASRRALNATFIFSAVINLLMLAGPIFMLQVYDRVLSSSSFPTLVNLFAITVVLYAIIGVLELVRSRIVSRVGAEIDQRLSDRIFEASLRKSLATQGAAAPALRELDSFRQFIAGPAPLTFFDAPWTPVYLIVIFLTHWMLGVAASIGTLILLGLAWASEQSGREPLMQASRAVSRSLEMAETGQRNAEAITAMGMLGAYRRRWQALNEEGLGWQLLAADRLGGLSALTKTMRLLLQSMMLAIAAGLAITGAITPGSIIAATIIFGRALAPVEQIIGHWRGFIKARESYYKLEEVLTYASEERQRTVLPRPKGILDVQNIRVAAPESRTLILNGISFSARPGQMLAIIGPSASGKSTLARALVGLWPTAGGSIVLDGARLDQWHGEDLGGFLGYLPQTVELFAGSVRQNIARFRDDAPDDAIIEAAKQAHAHELILALPHGYDTELGTFGSYLSGGQRQRIALARALFGNPPLVVLDEPNSNLDRPGDEALSAAIDGMRQRDQTVVLISHRVQAISKADLLLFLESGQQRAFGPRNDVMRLFQSPPQPQRQPARGGAAANADAKPSDGAPQNDDDFSMAAGS